MICEGVLLMGRRSGILEAVGSGFKTIIASPSPSFVLLMDDDFDFILSPFRHEQGTTGI
jgi:hypothetical protein